MQNHRITVTAVMRGAVFPPGLKLGEHEEEGSAAVGDCQENTY